MYKKYGFVVYFFFFFLKILSSACGSCLKNGICSSRPSVQKCKAAKHRNKLNKIQNIPGQKEKDFTQMKKVTFEKIVQKGYSEGSHLKTSSCRVSGRAVTVCLQKQF